MIGGRSAAECRPEGQENIMPPKVKNPEHVEVTDPIEATPPELDATGSPSAGEVYPEPLDSTAAPVELPSAGSGLGLTFNDSQPVVRRTPMNEELTDALHATKAGAGSVSFPWNQLSQDVEKAKRIVDMHAAEAGMSAGKVVTGDTITIWGREKKIMPKRGGRAG